MAKLNTNKIYKTYVEKSGTPFHIWIDAEIKKFQNKTGATDEEMKSKPERFNRYLNNRYRAGGDNLWPNYINKVMNEPEKNTDAEDTAPETKQEVSTRPNNSQLPFMQRRYLNMPAPIAAGLGLIALTSVALATIAVVRYVKKNKGNE